MRLLFDSHVVLWWLSDDAPIQSIRDIVLGAGDVRVSAASLWELEIKRKLGRLTLPGALGPMLRERGMRTVGGRL